MLKKNVEVFGEDAIKLGGYAYTVSDRLSTHLSNERTTRGLAEIIDLKGKTVLDVGCGDGFFTAALLDFKPEKIVAIDPSEGSIEVARQKNLPNVTFEVADLYRLTPEDYGVFDVVVLRGVIHHVSDAALACATVCKLGREIIGMEPNGANPVLKVIEKTSRYHIEHEEKSYLPSTLDRYFMSGGAKKIRGNLINLVPIFSPDWMASLCRFFEPFVEAIPGLRLIGCGQYIFRYRTDLGLNEEKEL